MGGLNVNNETSFKLEFCAIALWLINKSIQEWKMQLVKMLSDCSNGKSNKNVFRSMKVKKKIKKIRWNVLIRFIIKFISNKILLIHRHKVRGRILSSLFRPTWQWVVCKTSYFQFKIWNNWFFSPTHCHTGRNKEERIWPQTKEKLSGSGLSNVFGFSAGNGSLVLNLFSVRSFCTMSLQT